MLLKKVSTAATKNLLKNKQTDFSKYLSFDPKFWCTNATFDADFKFCIHLVRTLRNSEFRSAPEVEKSIFCPNVTNSHSGPNFCSEFEKRVKKLLRHHFVDVLGEKKSSDFFHFSDFRSPKNRSFRRVRAKQTRNSKPASKVGSIAKI